MCMQTSLSALTLQHVGFPAGSITTCLINSLQLGVIVLQYLKCNLTHDENITQIRFKLLFSFVCYQGFHAGKEEQQRERRIEGGGDKQHNKAAEAMTEVNRNLAKIGQRLPHISLASVHVHMHA